MESDLTTLLYALEKVKRYKCSVADCKVQKGLDALHNPLADTNVLLMFLEDDYIKQLDKILQNKYLSEMMEIFLLENN